jgi:hypothetical protein
MPTILESHLSLLEGQAEIDPAATPATRASAIQDLLSLHTAFFDVLERRLGSDGVTEADRPLVPLFQRWLTTARRIAPTARALREQGERVTGIDDLARAMNRAKQVAEGFDYFVALNQMTLRGEVEQHVPLNEVLDELRH